MLLQDTDHLVALDWGFNGRHDIHSSSIVDFLSIGDSCPASSSQPQADRALDGDNVFRAGHDRASCAEAILSLPDAILFSAWRTETAR